MPELPEVSVIIEGLKPILIDKKIEKVSVYREKNVFSGAKEFEEKIRGSSVKSISRMGKYLIFALDNGYSFECHLRMEGKFYLREKGEEKDKHDLVDFYFEDGTRLSYNDVRKFGGFYLAKSENLILETGLKDLGKEPFDLSGKEFYELIKKDNRPIKEILLDQKKIAGIGNIYDSEILFATHIHPLTKGKELTLRQCDAIIKESIRILNEAISFGGSTIRSFHPGKGIDGMMQNELLVYGKLGEKCPRCGFPIRRIFVAGRSAFYCPKCQSSYNKQFIVGVVGPIASGKSTVSKYLVDKGYIKLDADKMVWEAYELPEIQTWINENIVAGAFKNGKVDRKLISKAVTDNPEKKALLEKYIHPYVIERMNKEIQSNPNKKILLDVPLLIGGPLEDKCDLIIYIEADEDIRRKRIIERGRDPELALKLNASYPKKKAKAVAGLILSGNGSVDELISQLKACKYL